MQQQSSCCFCCTTQEVIDRLSQLLKSYSQPQLERISQSSAGTASSSRSAAAVAGPSPSASQSDARQPSLPEHADATQPTSQASLPAQFASSLEVSGEDCSGVGLIQNKHAVVQPMVLASLLPCLPRHHTFSPAMVADCAKWFVATAEDTFLWAARNQAMLYMPYITPYLQMMRES